MQFCEAAELGTSISQNFAVILLIFVLAPIQLCSDINTNGFCEIAFDLIINHYTVVFISRRLNMTKVSDLPQSIGLLNLKELIKVIEKQ